MRDIATATLSGNLTRDVELKSLPSGTDVARLRVATTTRRRGGEEWVDKTNYFTVEVYGAQARSCAQYLHKGSRVFVDAELDWREWTDQQEHKREAVTFKARQVLFEGSRPGAHGAPEHRGDDGPDAAERPGEEGSATRPAVADAVAADDLPFWQHHDPDGNAVAQAAADIRRPAACTTAGLPPGRYPAPNGLLTHVMIRPVGPSGP
jgi:single-strand DNA-binding protein